MMIFPERHSIQGRTRSVVRTMLITIILAAAVSTGRESNADETAMAGTIRLSDGSRLSGQLLRFGQQGDDAAKSTLEWNCPLFLETLKFQLAGGALIEFSDPVTVEGEPFQITLSNGDLISADVKAIDAERIQLVSQQHGELTLPTAEVVNAQRPRDLFVGPKGLDGWKILEGEEKSWRSNTDGELLCYEVDSAIFRSLPLGDCELLIELESVSAAPQFALGFTDQGADHAVVTTYGPEVVVLSYKSGEIPDVKLLEVDEERRQLFLRVQWQQQKRKLTVRNYDLEVLGEMTLPEDATDPKAKLGIYLSNLGDDLRLTQLRVSRSFLDQSEVAEDDSAANQIVLQDGRKINGTVRSTDGTTVVVEGADGEERVELAEIIAIGFDAKSEGSDSPDNTTSPRDGLVTATWSRGDILTGQLKQIGDDGLTIESDFAGVVRTQLRGLASLKWYRSEKQPARGSDQLSSTITRGLNGTVVLGDKRAPILWKQDQTTEPVLIDDSMAARITLANWGVADQDRFPERLYTESGDVIVCRLVRSNDEAFEFDHPLGERAVLKFSEVRAVELQGTPNLPNSNTRERVLTIPRFRADDPFMHALIAANGDVLRGHLVSVDDLAVRFDSRGEEFRFDRKLIATIVCVNDATSEDTASSTADDTETDEDEDAAAGTRPTVQLRMSGDMVASLKLKSSETERLMGQSATFGECRISADAVEEIRFGRVGPRHRYRLWTPLTATEPRWEEQSVAPEDANRLVGTEAEDFELAELDGEPFRLSDHRGKIVVLDFWASWCGPCIRALPEYVEAVSEFDENQVVLLGVNISDSPKKVREFRDEQDLESLRVLLDHRQQVAKSFAVTGIPHTVVIGRDGVIEHVQVGYSRKAAEELKQTIDRLGVAAD